MKGDSELQKALVRACQQAATQLGSGIKSLSWFYKNSAKANQEELKKAA